MNPKYRHIMTGLFLILASVAWYNFYQQRQITNKQNITFSEFVERTNSGLVYEVRIRGEDIRGRFTDGHVFSTYVPFQDRMLIDRLLNNGVRINAAPLDDGSSYWMQMLISWLPTVIICAFWWFLMRSVGGRGGSGRTGLMFNKSRAKKADEDDLQITFDDVAGIEDVKDDLLEIVDFLMEPEKFTLIGARIPRGVLLVGPPGTGKTLLAKAVAHKASVPFLFISGSDFVEMFVGVGAGRVRDLFQQAKELGKCIIFIDEIDAVGRARGSGVGGGNDEREQTLNQLLVEMDGFTTNSGIVVIAATNRADVLDPALLRPGRFDRQIHVGNPDLKTRFKILSVHAKRVSLDEDVDVIQLARGTPGFSGADLANLINEAAMVAVRRDLKTVTMACLEYAKDKIMLGAERLSLSLALEDRKITAYHEASHATVAFFSEDSHPIYKATITPRGSALGLVMRLPELKEGLTDTVSIPIRRLKADLAVAVAGRLGEEIFFGLDNITTGASSDIQMATDMATRMVTQWGMSPELGMIHYDISHKNMFFGSSSSQGRQISNETSASIDKSIRDFIEHACIKARNILITYTVYVRALAEELLISETLSGDQIKELFESIKNKENKIIEI